MNDALLSQYVHTFDGYHIGETHFKIGAKLHSEDFYYAKRLFQNSFYTARLAMLIATKIKNEYQIPQSGKIILVGYEMYSELLLSLVGKFLKDNDYNNIKHCVGIDNEDEFYFKPNDKKDIFWINEQTKLLEECTAVIIVPIASTGSTAIKTREAIEKTIRKIATPILKEDNELEYRILEQINKIKFSHDGNGKEKDNVINVIAAQDTDENNQIKAEFKDIIGTNNDKQERLIELKAKWYLPDKCKKCGFGDKGFKDNEALFCTDKSYLTPALIFDKPKGKVIKDKEKDKTGTGFETAKFTDSLKYKSVVRNNDFFLYSVNSPRFIKDNEDNKKITDWLKKLNKEFYNTSNEKLKINSTNRVILLAPCHETNSEFLNLVNEYVFNASATIIHHQTDVDYIENFKLLNAELLKNANKIFYVDDNLISGKSFFDIYHLFRDTVEDYKDEEGNTHKKGFTGAILLRDSSTQETHDRFLRAVNQCRAFVAYNMPPSLSFDSKKPLEHERKRYADLRQFALHDVLIKIFDNKESELNVETAKQAVKEEHKNNHEVMFRTTHKIFEYFTAPYTTNEIFEPDLIVNLLKHCFLSKESSIDNKITLFKVLSQYPFILYKPLKEEVFNGYKAWLKERIESLDENLNFFKKLNKGAPTEELSEDEYKQFFIYDDFKELKFLIRRAVFLDNMQIVDDQFRGLLCEVFEFLDNKYLKKYHQERKKTSVIVKKIDLFGEKRDIETSREKNIYKQTDYEDIESSNLNDFPIFLVRIYLELALKNGWAAVKLLENIKKAENKKNTENTENVYAQRFFRMLKLELASVTNEFYDMLISQYDKDWRDIYAKNEKGEKELSLVESTEKIRDFFKYKCEKLLKTNKFEVAKQVLGIEKQIEIEDSPFLNYLWIKQLIHADTHVKPHLSKEIGYQDKINAIIKKMKAFFPADKNVQAFFVVTDVQDKAYVVNDDEMILNRDEFENEYGEYKTDSNEGYKFKTLISFLKGKEDSNSIAKITTEEYQKKKDNWEDCYNPKNEDIKLDFLDDNTKCLYLVRLSELKEDNFRTFGMLGFYCNENLYEKPDDILLPKQLLMLLRRDLSKFILHHIKNDEFAALRIMQVAERYAYLAGHGRLTLQRLAFDDDNHKKFVPFVRTIEKLQFMFATKYNDTKNELLKDFEPCEVTKNIIQNGFGTDPIGIKDLAELVYKTKNIESNINETNFEIEVNIHNLSNFRYNKDILYCICFELIWNAKKNIFRFLNCTNLKNKLTIDFETENGDLLISFKSTGTKFNPDIAKKINNNIRLKGDNEQEGLHFIKSLIKDVSSGSELKVPDPAKLTRCTSCENTAICPVFENEIKITLKPMQL